MKPQSTHTMRDRPTEPTSWMTPLGEMKIPEKIRKVYLVYLTVDYSSKSWRHKQILE